VVVDQCYTLQAATEAFGVGKGSMENWGRQLRQERQGKTPVNDRREAGFGPALPSRRFTDTAIT